MAVGGGVFKFPQGVNFGEVVPQLEDCEYFQLPQMTGASDRHYLLKFPEKEFMLSMMERSITLVKM